MPTVPSSFVPQIATEAGAAAPYQATPVQPIQDFGARQTAALGKSITDVGGATASVGLKLLNEFDEAKSKEIETNYLKASMSILQGKNGYFATNGKDAADRYGQTISQLNEAASSAIGAADNDTQRQMIQNAVVRHNLNNTATADNHRTKEITVYASNEAKTRASNFADLAVGAWESRYEADDETGRPKGLFHENMIVALDEVHKVGQLNGVPEGSAQMKALEQSVWTQASIGVAEKLALNKDYSSAIQFVKEQKELDHISSKVSDELLRGLAADQMRVEVETYTEQIMNGSLGRTGDEFPEPRTKRQAYLWADENITDSDIRRFVKQRMGQEYAQIAEFQFEAYRELRDRVEDVVADPKKSFNDIDPKDFALLRPSDQEFFMRGQRAKDDENIMWEIARDPSKLTPEYLEIHRNQISRGTYVQLRKALEIDPTNGVPTMDADHFNRILTDGGYGYWLDTNARDADKQNLLRMKDNIKIEIDGLQTRLGRDLSWQEKDAIFQRRVNNQISLNDNWWWGSSPTKTPFSAATATQMLNAYELDANDKKVFLIDPMEQAQARNELRGVLGRQPRDQEVVDYLNRRGILYP
jgi:hypothetical protein